MASYQGRLQCCLSPKTMQALAPKALRHVRRILGESLMRPTVASSLSEVNPVSQKEACEATTQRSSARHRSLLRCLLLIGSACLTVLTDRALCREQPIEGPASNASSAQSPSVATPSKRPVTVADSIQMTL